MLNGSDDVIIHQQTLCIFTNEYPYRNGESYLVNELKVLADKFDTVKLFPLYAIGKPRALPNDKIEVITLFDTKVPPGLKLLFLNFFLFITIICKEFFSCPDKKEFLIMLPELKSRLLQNIYRAKKLKEYIIQQNFKNVTYYSFWTDDWATVLSILKKQKMINRFISRVHGYDLYKERWRLGIIPFRYFQLKQVSKIIAVSTEGLHYMKNLYPQYQHKFKLNHLNVFDKGMNPWEETAIFTIVSCSNLIPLKRVGLIAEALKYVNFKLNWIHFGDGEMKQTLQEQIKQLPSNVSVSFKGDVPNSDVIDFYKTHSINLFIHMSETEGGVPLALQEAASFGIPLIGAEVGGVSEIVTEKTGILTKSDITGRELSNLIEIFKNSQMNTREFRLTVKHFWKNGFDANMNYKNLYKKIVVDSTD